MSSPDQRRRAADRGQNQKTEPQEVSNPVHDELNSSVAVRRPLVPSHPPSPAPSAAILRFLRACYDAEYRATSVTNLLHKTVRHLQFIEGDELLLSGMLPRAPVGRWETIAAIKEARLYPREKSLLYCAFPIIGRIPKGPHKRRALCAPLLIYPARLYEEAEQAFLEVDLERQQINLSVLAEFVASTTETDLDVESLIEEVPRPPFDKDKVHHLMSLLGKLIPALDVLSLHWFPRLKEPSFVRTVMRKAHAQRPVCLSACAVGLFRNSLETRGVLFELDKLARTNQWSRPLREMLQPSGERPPSRPDGSRRARAPAILSRAQQRIVQSAEVAPLTLVVGPPGTGKSYTIAAIAVDHLSRGESVLIACRKQQAVDVVADKITELLGPNQCTLRGGEPRHQRALKRTLTRMLEGIRSSSREGDADARRRARDLEKRLARAVSANSRFAKSLTRHLRMEEHWGRLSTESDADLFVRNFFRRCRLWWLERQLGGLRPLWERLADYQVGLRETSRITRDTLTSRVEARVQRTLERHRNHLTTFLRSIRTMSSMRQKELFAEIDPRILFGAFPIWLTSVADVSEIVPLECELFDTVIFDEATQCDPASCLPVVQRARRAVVVGDPHQLRHVSFLGNERIRQLANQHALDQDQRQTFHYRRQSFLDVVNERIPTQQHVHFLDEHFRSLPQIISFSNAEFYSGALAVMRQNPHASSIQCVFPKWIEGGKKIGGANPIEGEALIEEVQRQIASRAKMPAHACQTMGVVSPFRDQVDWLTDHLHERIPIEAIERHRLQIGTAHAFQGDERDLMFLSFVVDADVHNASLRFVDKPNLFNVAISRARHQQFVFHSILPEHLPSGSLLRRYLEFIGQPVSAAPTGSRSILDAFLRDVTTSLNGRGFATWPEYELAGLPIDLVVEKSGRTLGLDLIGYPGMYESSYELERYRILQRAGFVLFPLPYSRWKKDPESCLAAIEQVIYSGSGLT